MLAAIETALREFNCKASGACRALTMADLIAGQRFHVTCGKIIFYWFDAGSTALIDEFATDVVWVPVAGGGGRGTLAESFPFTVAAARVRDVLVALDEADAYAGVIEGA